MSTTPQRIAQQPVATDDDGGLLTPADVRVVILAVLAHDPGATVPRDELERIVEWAQDAACTAALLRLVLEGRAAMRWPEGASEPRYRATTQAEARTIREARR